MTRGQSREEVLEKNNINIWHISKVELRNVKQRKSLGMLPCMGWIKPGRNFLALGQAPSLPGAGQTRQSPRVSCPTSAPKHTGIRALWSVSLRPQGSRSIQTHRQLGLHNDQCKYQAQVLIRRRRRWKISFHPHNHSCNNEASFSHRLCSQGAPSA